MILDKFISVFISYRNITFYREKNYNVSINQFSQIKTEDMNPNSISKINVICDICDSPNFISFQKYTKSCQIGGYYSCRKCSHFKVNRDIESLSISIKIAKNKKYDKITEDIEKCGYLMCKKCNNQFGLSYFRKNRNGRYSTCCSYCRTEDFKKYYQNLPIDVKGERKRKYYKKSFQQIIWRSILTSFLSRKKIKKNGKTFSLLKYSHQDLTTHLESKFDENMNWENYGNYWQVDHIIPISLFIDSTPTHVVNSLDNLRPLEKRYNLSRSNKLDDSGFKIFNKFETYIKDIYINKYKNKI